MSSDEFLDDASVAQRESMTAINAYKWEGAVGMAPVRHPSADPADRPCLGPRTFAVWDASMPRVECRWRSASLRPVADNIMGTRSCAY